jgi:hypothetical protein
LAKVRDVIDAQTYLEHIDQDGERILRVSEGRLDAPVPTCPGNNVGSLLWHTAGVCLLWSAWLIANKRADADWSGFGTDVWEGFKKAHALIVNELRSRDPDQPTWTWGADQHVRFAYRRIAQELSIHRWDFESAVGEALPIDPTLAVDGVQEFLDEFSAPPPRPLSWRRDAYRSASELFGGDGERLRFACGDVDASWTLKARPDRLHIVAETDADVTATGTASNINLFFWGRIDPSKLATTGDISLLHRWHERVKI